MELMLLRQFQRQVDFQCSAVRVSADQLEVALDTGDFTGAWIAVQNLLAAAANIAKVCWGSGGKLAEQRRPVRKSLAVLDDSPLRNVAMRNNFEHLDERLDTWWKTSKQHNQFDMNIMPPSAIAGAAEIDMFRFLDPATRDLVFWGERFNLREIVEEVERIAPLAAKEAGKPHWEA